MAQSAKPPDLNASGQPVGSVRPPDLDASGNAVVPRGTSQPDKDGFVPLGSVSPEVDARLRAGMSQDDWNAMTPGERAREFLKWGGHALGAMTSMGPDPTDHPVATLAGAAVPMAAGKAIAAMPTGTAGKVVSLAAHKGGSMLLRSLGVPKPMAEAAIALVRRQAGSVVAPSENAGGRLVPKVAQPSLEDELVSAMRPDAPASVTLPPHVPTPATKTTTRVYEAPKPAAPPPASPKTVSQDRIAQGMSSAGRAPAPPPAAAPPPAPPAVTPPAPVVAPRAVYEQPPASAPAPPVAGKAMSPQRLANELGLAAKRANADFNADQYAAAEALVGQGLTPVQAVLKIKSAAKSVNAAADLARLLGTPTDEAMQAQIAARQYKN